LENNNEVDTLYDSLESVYKIGVTRNIMMDLLYESGVPLSLIYEFFEDAEDKEIEILKQYSTAYKYRTGRVSREWYNTDLHTILNTFTN
jgi:hypothetical protein